jgi:hypothetical protein
MPGNPLVRFDEGRVGRTARCSPSLLLYRLSQRSLRLCGEVVFLYGSGSAGGYPLGRDIGVKIRIAVFRVLG